MTPWIEVRNVLVSAALGAFSVFGRGAAAVPESPGLDVSKSPPAAVDFTVQTLDGRAVRLSELKDTVVFLNFWATWCVPCREEMPAMERVHHALPAKRFRILAVNLSEPRDAIDRFARELKLTFDIALDPDGALARAYGVNALPMTYIIDRKGRIVARALGARPWDQAPYIDTLRALVHMSDFPGPGFDKRDGVSWIP